MHAEDLDAHTAEIKPFPGPPHRWFAVSESVLDHPIVGPAVAPPRCSSRGRHAWQPFALWMWMMGTAAYREHRMDCDGIEVFLRRGQLAFSLRFLATKANWSVKSVRVFLDRLERLGMIVTTTAGGPTKQLALRLNDVQPKKGTDRGTARGTGRTIITICNYDKYQAGSDSRGTAWGTGRGTAGAQRSTKDTKINNIGAAEAATARVSRLADGSLQLCSDLHAFWLGEFGGDETELRLVLTQVASYVRPNDSSRPLESQVSSQLASQARLWRHRQGRGKPSAGVTRFTPRGDRASKAQKWQELINGSNSSGTADEAVPEPVRTT